MGRKVDSIKQDVITYVLEIEGNRDRYLSGEDPNPFEVDLEPMSGADVDKMERDVAKFTRGRVNVVQRAQSVRDDVLARRIKVVRNYEFQAVDNGDILAPSTGQELVKMLARGPGNEKDLVCDELEEALRDHSFLTRGLRDRLSKRLDSS